MLSLARRVVPHMLDKQKYNKSMPYISRCITDLYFSISEILLGEQIQWLRDEAERVWHDGSFERICLSSVRSTCASWTTGIAIRSIETGDLPRPVPVQASRDSGCCLSARRVRCKYWLSVLHSCASVPDVHDWRPATPVPGLSLFIHIIYFLSPSILSNRGNHHLCCIKSLCDMTHVT